MISFCGIRLSELDLNLNVERTNVNWNLFCGVTLFVAKYLGLSSDFMPFLRGSKFPLPLVNNRHMIHRGVRMAY